MGRYDFVVQNTDGQCIQFMGADSRIVVKEGQTTAMPTFDVSKVN